MKSLLRAFILGISLTFTLSASVSSASPLCRGLFLQTIAKPKLYIVSAPSGAGKTTLINKLMAQFPGTFAVSISTTTRSPRPGEKDGVDYNFTSVDAFKEQIKAGDFVEWAEVHGNFYGTSRSQIEKNLAAGRSVFLNINVEGADNIRKAFPNQAEGIFVSPPSLEILEKRLRGRGTETEANIQKRLKNARDEMKHIDKFENVIVNDDLDKAYNELRRLVLP